MSKAGPVRIVGAGLAGLATAVRLASRGVAVELSDGAAQAGGRCRSYFDPQLGLTIDNGNHFVFSGNTDLHAYLREIGALDRLRGPKDAEYPFLDLNSGARWTIRPNDSPLAWWVAAPSRRVPGTHVTDYLRLVRLLSATPDQRVGDVIATDGSLWHGLVEPVLVGALNTPAADCSAVLAAAVIRETMARGGRAYKPRSPEPTLASAFVDPAIAYIQARGGTVRLGRRLRGVEFKDDAVARLLFPDGEIDLTADEPAVIALPAWAAQDLLPGVSAPDVHSAIVNGHFRREAPAGAPLMQGVLGGTAQWVFAFPDRISTTTSAADAIVDVGREELARRLWCDVIAAYALAPDSPMPVWQVVKEKRATFAATPAQDAKRPPPSTKWRNLILAGDWTQTGLPATIEGAVRSGFRAADLALQVRRV